MRRVFIAVSLLGVSGCGAEQPPQAQREPQSVAAPIPAQTPPGGVTLTQEQQTAYDKCLQDNMAVAMAWAVMEQQCLEQVTGTGLTPPQ